MTHSKVLFKQRNGFTLVEMAIVLSIIALVLGAGLTLFSAQQDQRRIEDTNHRLAAAQEALIGFAIANGRLPCPASATSNGVESPPGGGICTNPYNGYLPAATLGFTPINGNGYAIDSWNNPVRYAVTPANGNAFTTTGGMSSTGMATLAPDLKICSTTTGINGSPPSCASITTNTSLATNGVPAVIYSTGKNGADGGTGADEAENPNPNSADNDRVFISHSPNPAEATGGYFDDQVIWLSQYTLFNRMVQAGKLP